MAARSVNPPADSSEQATIDEYIKGCRARIEPFLETHYTLKAIWRVQQSHLLQDLWRLPLNALWAAPYLALKKIAESLDKAGWPGLLQAMEHFPAGLKTSLQDHFEEKIAKELFCVQHGHDIRMGVVKKELKKYAAGRAVIANLSSTLTTLLLGRILFDQGNLGASGLVKTLSQSLAQDRAASNFVLGKGLGKTFYGVFRPETTFTDTILAAMIFLLFLTAVTGVLCLLYFPLREKLGLERKKLHRMVDEIGDRLLIDFHKDKKTAA